MQDFAELVAGKTVAIVSHDAGAANIIAAGLATSPGSARKLQGFCRGPAAAIFAARLPGIAMVETLDDVLQTADLLIAGTGWQTSLEFDGLCQAQARAIPSYSVIDHWVNYAARFQRGDAAARPSAVILTDADAFALADRELPGWDRLLFPNHYMANCLADITPVSQESQSLLYLCEPANSTWGGDRPGEFQALDYLAANAAAAGIPASAAWDLRPHPSEPPGKYDAWAAAHPDLRITIRSDESLASAISRARWAVGCQSYALTIALAAKRDVVSCLPPWAPPCQLPHAGIVHLHALPGAQA